MPNTFLDIRQSETRILQDQLNGSAIEGMDLTLASINSEVTSPGRLIATTTPSLVVNIGSGTVVNPNTSKNRVLPPIASTFTNFTGGTLTFPSTSGNITISTGGTAAITIGASQFVAVLVQLTSAGLLALTVGTAASSLGAVVVPTGIASYLSLGYIIAQSNASSVIQNITNAMLYQLSTAAASSSVTFTAPTVQILNYIPVIFTVTALSTQTDIGAVYTSGVFTYTVNATATVGATSLYCNVTGNGLPPTTGTLTLSSGTGQSSISYSNYATGGGSQTYILPSSPSPLYLRVRLVGPGGGGGGSGSPSSGQTSGSNGNGSTVFGVAGNFLVAGAGGGGQSSTTGIALGGAGGTTASVGSLSNFRIILSASGTAGSSGGGFYSTADIAIAGGLGGAAPYFSGNSGQGYSTVLASGAGGNGGQGEATSSAPFGPPAAGGGSGAYIEAFIFSPASIYDWGCGFGGNGGVAGTVGNVGQPGAMGQIIVEEYYQ